MVWSGLQVKKFRKSQKPHVCYHGREDMLGTHRLGLIVGVVPTLRLVRFVLPARVLQIG